MKKTFQGFYKKRKRTNISEHKNPDWKQKMKKLFQGFKTKVNKYFWE